VAIWRNLLGLVSGAANRQVGIQYGQPAYYSNQAAAPVTPDTALQLSAVWACTRLISESVASLPIYIYKKDPLTGTRVLLPEHPLSKLLSGKVNRWQTRQEFFETLTYQLVLLGNNYAAVQRNKAKEIISIVPLMSEQMEVTLEESGARVYRYQNGKDINFYSEDTIWHNKLFGNGIIGLSPLAYARNSIGIASAAEDSVSKIYRNGGKPSGILTIDKVLKPEQRKAIKDNFSELSEGNTDRLFVLEAGMDYKQVSLSPQDIELLASRRFQIEDICRFFGVPSVLVNDTSAGTTWGSGIQQIVQGFYKLGLRPYLERYEASMKAALLTPEERLTIDIEFDFNALLRPDQAERIKMYKDAVQGGVMTPNEARAQEGWAAKEGGDSLLVQQQMVKLENIDDVNRGSNGQNQQQTL
jgi:HK97 family phage portal protein